MKADMHVHSSYSSDGVSTPEQIVDAAVEFGLGCVAITDHNSFEAYEKVKDNGRIIVIPAIEVSSAEGHILGFGIDRDIPRGMSIQETIDMIHASGGFAFAAHPYRWWSGIGESNTRGYDFDGVEARNARSVRSSNKKSEKLATEMKKPITAGSDAHSPSHIGRGYIELPDGLATWKDVVRAVMDGHAVARSSSRHAGESLKYGFKSISEWVFRGFRRM